MDKQKTNIEFDQIAILIHEARNRAFSKVNEELVLLYFNVGQIVSNKVASRMWGDNTVGELADYIQNSFLGFNGFTRRGLYRMKQFYEVYSPLEFVSPIATQLEAYFLVIKESHKMSALPTLINKTKSRKQKVSATPTQNHQFKILQSKLAL